MVRKYLISMKVIFIAVFCCFFLTGCWDAKDINTYDIITTVGNDYDNGEYVFLSEITNVKKIVAGQKPSIESTYNESRGKTIVGTRDSLNRKNENLSFLGTARAIIFTNRFAEKTIVEYLNRIRGLEDYRKTVLAVTTSTDIKTLLKSSTERTISTGDLISHNYRSLEEQGATFSTNAGMILEDIAINKAGFLLPQYDLVKEDVALVGYSIFKDGSRIGFLSAEQRRGTIYLLGNKPTAILDVMVENGKVNAAVTINKLKITPKMDGAKLSFLIDVQTGVKIQYTYGIKYIYPYLSKQIESHVSDMVKYDIMDALNRAQKNFRCDYLDMYKYFRIKYPDEFKASDWNEKFAEAVFSIKVKSKITSTRMSDLNPTTRWPY